MCNKDEPMDWARAHSSCAHDFCCIQNRTTLSFPAGPKIVFGRLVGRPRGLAGGLGKRLSRLNTADLLNQWVGAPFIVTASTPVGPSGARLGLRSLSRTDPYATREQTKGKMRWSGYPSLLRRQLDRIVHPRLTEILVEVADIPVGAGEACPFRVGIRAGASARPLHGVARVAAVFATGRLVLYAPTSLGLPAAVAGIGVRLGFRGRLCSLPGPRTLAVVVLRTGPGRGLARLAVVVPRPAPSRGFARLDGIAPTHAFGWASVEGHGARRPEKQADGEEECCGGTGTCGRRCEGHCGKYQGGSTGRAHGNLHWGMDE